MKYLVRHTPEILLLIYIFLFLALRHPGQSWDRPVNSDGKGYYAYLPALFIYHDPGFHFVEYYENKYYPENRYQFKEFREHISGGPVNKYFPGLAVLWLPFFLIAHLLSFLLGFPADGYSLVYQLSIHFAALFYFWLGIVFLIRLLKKTGATPEMAAFIAFLTALGTNLVFFTVIEGSMGHVYSFSLVTIFLYSVVKFFETGYPRWLILSCLLWSLVVIIRPTNGLIILLVPFIYSLVKRDESSWQAALLKVWPVVIGLACSFLVISIPLLYWYHQTGSFFVYTYGQEKFDFLSPHFFSILFSYNRGWFIYTPIAFVSLGGLIGIFRKSRRSFFILLAFLFLFIYIASSWWMWYYTSKFGQRIFIDIYALTAILLVFLLNNFQEKGKKLSVILLTALTGFSCLQFYQHARFAFPAAYITKSVYWDSFFSLHPKARVWLPDNCIKSAVTFSNDMEQPRGWMNEGSITSERAFSGKHASLISSHQLYGVGLYNVIPGNPSDNRIIRISAMVYTVNAPSDASLVIDFSQGGKSISYNPFYLNAYALRQKWTRIETAVQVPHDLMKEASVRIYFYNPSENPLYTDDMKVDFLTLYDTPDFRNIEGVLLPCK